MKRLKKGLLSGALALSMLAGLSAPVHAGAAGTKTVFTDVAPTAYYAESVTWAVENNITSGTSATTFSPNNQCTNAQILTFLYRAAGSPAVTGPQPFDDVGVDAYYYDTALWAYEKGLVSGKQFHGGMPCTRGQVMTYLWICKGRPASSSQPDFYDVPANSSYADAVAWAVETGITSGTSETTFTPDATCSRGQIVTFLYRLKDVPAAPERAVAEVDLSALKSFGKYEGNFFSNKTFTSRQQTIHAANLYVNTNHGWAQHNATYLLDGKYNEFKAQVAPVDGNGKFTVRLMNLDTGEMIRMRNGATGEYVDVLTVNAGDKPVSIVADVSGVDQFFITVSTTKTWVGSAGQPWFYKTAGALYNAVLTYYE